jgi:DNA polymerase
MTDATLFIDFESRSPVDLKKEGLMRYARHPLTEAMMMAFAFDDEPVGLWHEREMRNSKARDGVLYHVQAGRLVVAHNAQFELAIWNFIMAKRYGWPILKPEQVRCTMAACYAMALPGALEDAGHALGLQIRKDAEGRALMLKMCKPKRIVTDTPDWQPGVDEVGVRADGLIYVYHDSPALRARLGSYCDTDVAVERDIYKRVLPLTAQEQRLWTLDQYINLRGIPVDMVSLEAALIVADTEKDRLNEEMSAATGGAVKSTTALPALKEWAADYGVMPDSLSKAEINELLGEEWLPDEVEAALKIRQAAGRFTSISKLKAIKLRGIASRVAYCFQYHAATTGRWAGRGMQPHNFTRDLPLPHQVEEVMRLLVAAAAGNPDAIEWLDMAFGEPSQMISKCLRGFMHASPGNIFLGGDFKSVEGRGIAWLAGEEWKLEAYREIDRDPSLPDMYKRTYGAAFGVEPTKVTKDQRQEGKVQDLAFGYQGGVGAYRTMGKTYGIRVVSSEKLAEKYRKRGEKVITEARADEQKVAWRESNPHIVQYWYALERAAIAAVREPGTITYAGAKGREVAFRKRGSFLWCRLPSGRALCYPYPEIHLGAFGRDMLTFKGVPDAITWAAYNTWLLEGREKGEENPTSVVYDPSNCKQWARLSTYGGKLAENVTQAICRDILAEAMLRVEAAGFKIVIHVHDEIVVEGVYTEEDLKRFEQIMTIVPVWAIGFPIAADCWRSPRYIKED